MEKDYLYFSLLYDCHMILFDLYIPNCQYNQYSLCTIARYGYGKWKYNVHIYITENIGISKHKKHLRLLSSGKKLFISFEFKGFST